MTARVGMEWASCGIDVVRAGEGQDGREMIFILLLDPFY